jgi:polysaccharide biosynthesis protein PslH
VKVLLLAPMVPQADGIGAIPKLLAAEVAGLAGQGAEVTLLAPYGDLPGQAEAAAALLESGADVHFVDGRRSADFGRRWKVRGELAAAWISQPWPWRAITMRRGMQELVDRIAGEAKFDVVAVEDSAMGTLALPQGVPAVLTEHEAVRAPAADWKGGPLYQRPLRALSAADWRRVPHLLQQAWRRFDLLQVFTRGDAAEIRSREAGLGDRVRINPYGTELPRPASPDAEVADLVLFTGTFTHLPNRDAVNWLATEIVPALRARRPGAVLRVVGSAPPPELLALARPGVEVIADAPSLEPHLAAASVVVAPIRTGGGMRMKVLEALALGKAVATTPRGVEGFTEFGPPPLRVADDAVGLADALADLLGDASARRRLGDDARAFAARHYSPSAWAERLVGIYREAIDEPARDRIEARR